MGVNVAQSLLTTNNYIQEVFPKALGKEGEEARVGGWNQDEAT